MKDKANGLFKAGDNKNAIEAYSNAVEHLIKMRRINQDARKMLITLYVNMSVAQNKEKMYDDTLTSCTKALDLEGENTKAMFLRGTALFKMEKFDEALRDATKAVQLKPNDK